MCISSTFIYKLASVAKRDELRCPALRQYFSVTGNLQTTDTMQKFRNIQQELIDRIKLVKSSIKIAVTWFTNHDLFDELLVKLAKDRIPIDLIVLNDRIKREGCNFQSFINNNGQFYYCDVNSIIHHKFCIIDDKLVITRSYNWTYYAENRNWENIVVIEDSSVVAGYVEEFDKIKNAHNIVKTISNNLAHKSCWTL
jgi:phosphatidylserine/phosphatidylglycerophosphate/cardiolipin synthase-like enzyme